jgi:hypothetical protein
METWNELYGSKPELKEQTLMFEMSNVRQNKTGLDNVIWIGPYMGQGDKHPRIKVQRDHNVKVSSDWVSISIHPDEPKILAGDLNNRDFNRVSDFIVKNYKGLMSVWNDSIDPSDFTNNIMIKI